jgi:hypothetical protein
VRGRRADHHRRIGDPAGDHDVGSDGNALGDLSQTGVTSNLVSIGIGTAPTSDTGETGLGSASCDAPAGGPAGAPSGGPVGSWLKLASVISSQSPPGVRIHWRPYSALRGRWPVLPQKFSLKLCGPRSHPPSRGAFQDEMSIHRWLSGWW